MSSLGWGVVLCGYAVLMALLIMVGPGLVDRAIAWWHRRG